MRVYPYKIIHIRVDEELPYLPSSTDYGYYLVCWWKDIPLGDWYINKGEDFNADAFKNTIEGKIAGAFGKYDSGKLEKYKDALLHIPATADVSLVICTRNRAPDLRKCLSALRLQKCKPGEIIVVDNAPSDNTTRAVVNDFPEAKYCLEPRPGLDIARNAGAKAASCPVIAYTDDDVEPHPLWIYHVSESFSDPRITAMTGLVIAAELDTESQQIFEKHWSFNRGYADKYYDAAFYAKHMQLGPPVWEIGAGANMAFRKTAFTEVGYFDERLDVGAAGCNGDSEMWFRILANGGTIHYNPRAIAFHKHRREMHQLKKQLFYYMRGFAAAALIQEQQDARVSYGKHLYKNLHTFYITKIIRHFPFYPFRYKTIFREMGGLISGIIYYRKHRDKTDA